MITIPTPELQIDFAIVLERIRQVYLQDALTTTVASLDIAKLDRELARFVPKAGLAILAQHGLRGELVFPVPLVLRANPHLLGYYRLLYGYSQKQFFTAQTGLASFATMEKKGVLSASAAKSLDEFCTEMAQQGAALLQGIGAGRITMAMLDHLTLLTLGPQLRGGANVKSGIAGTVKVFEVIQRILAHAVEESTTNRIVVRNAAGRKVLIEFAADPDITIKTEVRPGEYLPNLAIEVKGGYDFSNIHNRIGEAEKSHQKARAKRFTECWTIVNVDRINREQAHRESPSTDQFYRISDLETGTGTDFQDFRNRILVLTAVSD